MITPKTNVGTFSHTVLRAVYRQTENYGTIFAKFGENWKLRKGCCGMAGTYGTKPFTNRPPKRFISYRGRKKFRIKRGNIVWFRHSCRSQVKRIEHQITKQFHYKDCWRF